MSVLTQDIIDNAVLKIKTMQYKLNWELVKEEEYGGDISCCMTRLKLLWLWRRTLSCQQLAVPATGTIMLVEVEPMADLWINVFVDEVSISGIISSTTISDQVAFMNYMVGIINTYQSVYKATYDHDNQWIVISAGNSNHTLTATYGNGAEPVTITNFVGGSIRKGCLSDDQIKDLIGDINVMCK